MNKPKPPISGGLCEVVSHILMMADPLRKGKVKRMKYYEVSFATRCGADTNIKTYYFTNAAEAAETLRFHAADLAVSLDIIYPHFRQHALEKFGHRVNVTPDIKMPKTLSAAVAFVAGKGKSPVDIDSVKEGDRIYNPIAGLLIAMYDDDGTMLFCGKDYAWLGWEIDTFVWELVTDKDNKYNLVTDKWGFRGAGLPLSKEEKERLATL